MEEKQHVTMSCEEAQELLLGMLSGHRGRLIEHLAQCEECRVSMSAMEVMAFGELSPATAEMMRLSDSETPARPDLPPPTPPASARAPKVHPMQGLRRAMKAAGLVAVSIPISFWVADARANIKVEAAMHRVERTAQLTNLTYLEDQEEDHRTFSDKVESFDLGDTVVVLPEAPIAVTGTVRYPRVCRNYWLLFSEVRVDGVAVIWPQLAIRNSGLLSQTIDHELRVPQDMEREGEIALACVDKETHQLFRAWRRGSGPLLARDLEVVLRTVLSIEEKP